VRAGERVIPFSWIALREATAKSGVPINIIDLFFIVYVPAFCMFFYVSWICLCMNLIDLMLKDKILIA